MSSEQAGTPAPKPSGLQLPRGRLGTNALLLLVALYFVLTQNLPFWRHIAEVLPPGLRFANLYLLACLFVALFTMQLLIIAPLSARPILKPMLIIVLLLAAVCSYFMNTFGVVIDKAMIANALQTDRREAGELLGLPLLWHLLWAGVLPAVLVARVQIVNGSGGRLKALLLRVLLVFAAVALLLAMIASNYKAISLWGRQNREVRVYATPSYPVYSAFAQLTAQFKSKTPKHITPIGTDATRAPSASGKPRVVVLVVGETARAANFQLDGYDRQTTPELAAIDSVVSFTDVHSCGTATAVSVPCMFSRLDRAQFSDRKADAQENLLDVLQRTGVQVLWRDNNSDSKGVAVRVPYVDFRNHQMPGLCTSDSCFDEVLLDGLDSMLADTRGDRIVVLHLLGSHGPSYYRRYPPAFRRFTPDCAQDDVQSCSRDTIVNAYDNTLLYTDHVLAELIGMLQRHEAQIAPTLLYLSDHGESLGENGLYLHGMPYAFAPEEQTHIPLVLWSPELDAQCLRARRDQAYSQDNLFDTVLGLFDVHTSIYRPDADMTRGCGAAPAAASDSPAAKP
ncbi:phosphoethanolamine transferase [Solimonas terrae]|uniref:Phosphoethanolamine--lipid A transferase n=1 Tax=Solimonas terrae TaxID=1396819 RepID=A0A6M2BTJ2_9GAMM|nr:phosphoethanolamine--lipid A transferase [Solimonas terrae]NGY05982.1 phosphoethanolamine--lipid A transferase [Solimonas terrae]